jgi:hypothetical protein
MTRGERHPRAGGDLAKSTPDTGSAVFVRFLKKIRVLPTIPQAEDKFPIGAIFVYAARILSGADRSAPVYKR